MVSLLELLTLISVLLTVVWTVTEAASSGEWLTPPLVALIGAVWGVFTIAVHGRVGPGLDEKGNFAGTLFNKARSYLIRVGATEHLPEGTAGELVRSLGNSPTWRLPGWWAMGQPVLLSLGLVGTFLGLTLGLAESLPLLVIANAKPEIGDDLQFQAMSALFNYAQLAFLKSLVGVWCGMVWGLRLRQTEEDYEDELSFWENWLNSTYPPLTPLAGLVALKELDAERDRVLHSTVEKVVDRLSTMERSLGQALAQGLGDHQQAVVKGLREVVLLASADVNSTLSRLDRVAHSADDRRHGEVMGALAAVSDPERNGLKNILDRIGELAEALPEQIGSSTSEVLDPSFQELSKALKQLSESGGQALGAAFQEGMGNETQQLRDSLGSVARLLQDLGPKLTTQLAEADGRVQSGANAAAQALAQAGEAASVHLQGAVDRFSVESASLQNGLTSLLITVKEAQQVAVALRVSGEEVQRGFQGVTQELNVLPPVLERAREALDSSGEAVARGAEGARKVQQATELTLGTLARLMPANEALLERCEGLTREVQQVQEASHVLAEVLGQVSGGHQTASAESVRALAETAKEFGESLRNAQASVAESSRSTFEDVRDVSAEAAGRLAAVLEAGVSRLEQSLQAMAAYGQQIHEGLRAAQEVVDTLDERAQALGASVQEVGAPLIEAAGALRLVGPEVRLATDAIKAERQSFAGMSAQLAQQQAALTQASRDLGVRVEDTRKLQQVMGSEWAVHVRSVEELLGKVKQAWSQAIEASNAGIDKNAREISEYARSVERSLQLPKDLSRLTATLESLNDLLEELAAHLKGES